MTIDPHSRVLRRSVHDRRTIALKTLFQSSPDAIAVCDSAGQLVMVNEELCEMFGYREDELLGVSIDQLVPERFRGAHVGQRAQYELDPRVRAMGMSREVLGRRRDGCEVAVEIRLRRLEGFADPLFAAAVRDVSAIRMMDLVRRNSNRLLRRIAAGDPSDQVLADLAMSLEQANPGLACGVQRWDSVAQRYVTVSAGQLSRDFCEMINRWRASRERRGSGESQAGGGTGALQEALSDPGCAAVESSLPERRLQAWWCYEIESPGGDRLGILDVFHHEPREPRARELEFMTAAKDLIGIVLERDLRSQQLERREKQLRESQKLDAVGTLVGGIAHEFNNLLQVILGYTECALDGLSAAEDRYQDLTQVRTATEHACVLTQQLLRFSRRQHATMSWVDANAIIAEVAKSVRGAEEPRVSVVLERADSLPPLWADAEQLHQVLQNLGANARDAIDGEGTIRFSTREVELSPDESERLGGLPPGRAIVIAVSDTGCGMSAEIRERIFEPFFTTKQVGAGTGLGLSVAYAMVAEHRGAIRVDTALGRGTTVELYLPAAATMASQPPIVSAGVGDLL